MTSYAGAVTSAGSSNMTIGYTGVTSGPSSIGYTGVGSMNLPPLHIPTSLEDGLYMQGLRAAVPSIYQPAPIYQPVQQEEPAPPSIYQQVQQQQEEPYQPVEQQEEPDVEIVEVLSTTSLTGGVDIIQEQPVDVIQEEQPIQPLQQPIQPLWARTDLMESGTEEVLW